MVILNNSSVGSGDELIVEYRKPDPMDPRYDTRFMGMPDGNSPGLLIVDFDRQQRGYFCSYDNTQGRLPRAFRSTFENGIQSSGYYALSPTVEIKRRSGQFGSDANNLFHDGDGFLGSYPTDTDLFPLKSMLIVMVIFSGNCEILDRSLTVFHSMYNSGAGLSLQRL